jgi:hypothetical protein
VTEGNRMAMILAMGDDHSYPKITERRKPQQTFTVKGGKQSIRRDHHWSVWKCLAILQTCPTSRIYTCKLAEVYTKIEMYGNIFNYVISISIIQDLLKGQRLTCQLNYNFIISQVLIHTAQKRSPA